MINKILINGIEITDIPEPKYFKTGYEIQCHECKEIIKRKWYDSKILNTKYYCKICNLKLNNPMFNDKIKEKFLNIVKSKEYRENMSNKTMGNKNGFYGKTHKIDTMNKIKMKNKIWYDNLTDDEYKNWTEKMSIGQKKLMIKNPVLYKEIKSKASRASHKKQFMCSKMNKIEKKVHDFLNELNINHTFQ